MLEVPEARPQVVAFASVVRRIHERTAARVTGLRTAAATDDRVAELWRAHASGQEQDERLFVESLDAKGALRAGLTPEAALETVWAVTTPLFYAQCHEHGWTSEGYEVWLADTLSRLLLDEGS
jgi:hypothetical protein